MSLGFGMPPAKMFEFLLYRELIEIGKDYIKIRRYIDPLK
ncbi:hypothetical protein GXM_08427 [Nostoc sphaeroides CCNUC1]|uniref:Uncharacterized protein n=1 Tax=Nostoc sphaeroides CCNUC1 TaxID=2653204 RepID=A0A5P8WDN8_9NOSO|nr:hypothetical protein GXM_08427 [Nostoc sphaeroides CCNUC1]